MRVDLSALVRAYADKVDASGIANQVQVSQAGLTAYEVIVDGVASGSHVLSDVGGSNYIGPGTNSAYIAINAASPFSVGNGFGGRCLTASMQLACGAQVAGLFPVPVTLGNLVPLTDLSHATIFNGARLLAIPVGDRYYDNVPQPETKKPEKLLFRDISPKLIEMFKTLISHCEEHPETKNMSIDFYAADLSYRLGLNCNTIGPWLEKIKEMDIEHYLLTRGGVDKLWKLSIVLEEFINNGFQALSKIDDDSLFQKLLGKTVLERSANLKLRSDFNLPRCELWGPAFERLDSVTIDDILKHGSIKVFLEKTFLSRPGKSRRGNWDFYWSRFDEALKKYLNLLS